MNRIKSKFVSLMVVGCALTSANASANMVDNSENNIDFTPDNYDSNLFKVEEENLMHSKFKDGSELSWLSKNESFIYNDETPVGFNNHGIMIESEEDLDGSFESASDEINLKVSSVDFPVWALSKYSSIAEIEDGIKNIVISKNDTEKPLVYKITDTDNNSIKLKSVNGELKVI